MDIAGSSTRIFNSHLNCGEYVVSDYEQSDYDSADESESASDTEYIEKILIPEC